MPDIDPIEETLLQTPGLLSRWVRLPSGAKVHYLTSGEAGPSVILLHGGMIGASAAAAWRFTAPFLGANGFRVYCPDMPTFGLTQAAEDAYPLADPGRVDFLHEFVNALCIDRFHLSGNSLGCGVTIDYTLAHPERVAGIVMIAGQLGDLLPAGKIFAADNRAPEDKPAIVHFDGTEASMRRMMEALVQRSEAITDELVRSRTLIANRNREAWQRNFDEMFRIHGLKGARDTNVAIRLRTTDRLDKLTIPALYLTGVDDTLVPYETTFLQEDVLPNAQFFYVPGAGHQTQTDQPEIVNQIYLEFMREGKVSWETARRAGISDRRPPLPSVIAVPESAEAAA